MQFGTDFAAHFGQRQLKRIEAYRTPRAGYVGHKIDFQRGRHGKPLTGKARIYIRYANIQYAGDFTQRPAAAT
jgi:hypothetical protein